MAKETNKLPTIDIKGKEYVEVKTRVLELHRQNDSCSLTTEILSDDDKKVVMQTRLKIDNRIFTGIASENKDQDSPYENCETSSVGRCLGFYGIGIIESIERSDGMTKYHNKTSGSEPLKAVSNEATDKQIAFIKKLCTEKEVDELDYVIEGMTKIEASEIIETLNGIKKINKSDETENLPF